MKKIQKYEKKNQKYEKNSNLTKNIKSEQKKKKEKGK
jgi:hypothetical protein